ncbi:MAG: hypothetical protein JW983_09165 [Elusimicrobia bacterium]|nr:hypothetical protein [Elusimicrobiota bacterium]
MIFGKPLFIWLGILGFSCLIITAATGLLGKIKYHKIFAVITILVLIMHVLGALGVF